MLNVLLDANFLINLQLIGCVDTLVKVADFYKWNIYLPKMSLNEITRKNPLKDQLSNHVKENRITVISCNSVTFNKFQNLYQNLGAGELESISIAFDCPNKKIRPYLILSDDIVARKKGERNGIDFLGILAFFTLANNEGFLTRSEAIRYVDALKNHRFRPKESTYRRFLQSLV